MKNMTAIEVRYRVAEYHRRWAIQSRRMADAMAKDYVTIYNYIIADHQQNELALERMADDGCPLIN